MPSSTRSPSVSARSTRVPLLNSSMFDGTSPSRSSSAPLVSWSRALSISQPSSMPSESKCELFAHVPAANSERLVALSPAVSPPPHHQHAGNPVYLPPRNHRSCRRCRCPGVHRWSQPNPQYSDRCGDTVPPRHSPLGTCSRGVHRPSRRAPPEPRHTMPRRPDWYFQTVVPRVMQDASYNSTGTRDALCMDSSSLKVSPSLWWH